ncbi:hypothetical protein [uncultured Rhodoblastus sp.]|uniref:hypothetical protein n=1 Tax=uncultured Rhodoblastus sp. TaxID=543037 RepID=UPI0025F80E07|nr:hypothetical protein [uncultured Rhodoblastus sp.]
MGGKAILQAFDIRRRRALHGKSVWLTHEPAFFQPVGASAIDVEDDRRAKAGARRRRAFVRKTIDSETIAWLVIPFSCKIKMF